MQTENITVKNISYTSSTFKGETVKKKVLQLSSGEELTVTEKNKTYNFITAPGLYEVARNEHGALIMAKLISKDSSAATTQNEPAVKDAAPKPVTMVAREPSKFEIMKQKEIVKEFYMGLAKDIVLASFGGEPFNASETNIVESIAEIGKELYLNHRYFFYPEEKVTDVFPGSEEVLKAGSEDVPF